MDFWYSSGSNSTALLQILRQLFVPMLFFYNLYMYCICIVYVLYMYCICTSEPLLAAAVVSILRNYLFCNSLFNFYFISLVLSVGTRIALHIRDVDFQEICTLGGSFLGFFTWTCAQWTPVLWFLFSSYILCLLHSLDSDLISLTLGDNDT